MTKYIYELRGLSCAGCAAIIEQKLSLVNSITGVNIDFLDRKLSLFTKSGQMTDSINKEIVHIVKKIEPDIELVPTDNNYSQTRFRDTLLMSLKSVSTITALLGLVLILINLTIVSGQHAPYFFVLSYLLIAWPVLYNAGRRLFSRYLFNEHFLMSVATIGALFIGEYPEAIAVMLFYQVGKLLENKVVDYSQKSINELMSIVPEYVNIENEGQTFRLAPEKVNRGSIIIVKPGERIPLDCTVIEGTSEIDNSITTGESMPVKVSLGSSILSGAVNLHSSFKAKVNRIYSESNISRITEMIAEAKRKKTRTERYISRFAQVYTPIIMAAALGIATIPPLLVQDAVWNTWIYRSLIFLVISCPCALVLSVPLTFFAGLAVFVKNGILVKGAVHIENLAQAAVLFFDKTGTITTGRLKVKDIMPAKGINAGQLMKTAFIAESRSNHPLAAAINMKFHQMKHNEGFEPSFEEKVVRANIAVDEIPGKGLVAKHGEDCIVAGSLSFLKEQGIRTEELDDVKTTAVGIAENKVFLGTISFTDTIRPELTETMKKLIKKGFEVIMLTGDRKEAAREIAESINLSSYYAGLTPSDKMDVVTTYNRKLTAKQKTVFIGDGINDAPAMSTADIGIAMGGSGSAISVEAADMVLQTDEVAKIFNILSFSRKTLNKAKQNIAFALSIKALFIVLGAFGLITIWGAVFADVGVTVLAVLNSLYLLKYRKRF